MLVLHNRTDRNPALQLLINYVRYIVHENNLPNVLHVNLQVYCYIVHILVFLCI